MTATLTSATLPIFKTALTNLAHCMGKAQTNAAQRGFSPDAFMPMRLAPDMLTFASQIRIACDTAKNAAARVGGLEAPKFADDETTFAQLLERIGKTLAWLDTVIVGESMAFRSPSRRGVPLLGPTSAPPASGHKC